jgi:hypothetical protein
VVKIHSHAESERFAKICTACTISESQHSPIESWVHFTGEDPNLDAVITCNPPQNMQRGFTSISLYLKSSADSVTLRKFFLEIESPGDTSVCPISSSPFQISEKL